MSEKLVTRVISTDAGNCAAPQTRDCTSGRDVHAEPGTGGVALVL